MNLDADRNGADVILISPKNTQNRMFGRFVPKSVPLGAGLVAGYLRKKGLAVNLLDEEVVEINARTLKAFLERCGKPRIVGISCMTSNIARGYRIAEVVKSVDSEANVVFGGIHATTLPEEVLDHACDYAVLGEGEYAFLELVLQIKSKHIQPESLEAVIFRSNGKTVYTHSPWRRWVNLDELPMFPYDLLDTSRYDLGFILSSRGCPYDCTFCSQRAISKRVVRYASVEKTVQELDLLINGFGVPNITFFDDYFTPNRKRVYELCAAMRKAGFYQKCSFGVQTRGDSVDRELLQEMKSAGFTSLMFGVESASNEVLKVVNKNETVEDNMSGIRLAKELGFEVETTFIFGLPTEKFDDRLAALRLARDTAVDRARFNNPTPYPGTLLYRTAKEEGRLRVGEDWKNFSSVAALTETPGGHSLPYVPAGMTERELVGTILLANLLFYLRFSKLKRLFNPSQKGSGKWFELPVKKLLNPVYVLSLATLAITIFSRAIYYLIAESNCRKFFAKGIRL
ncbi:MAG: radical SAM protein [Chloroflexota bacterium]|nr:radical SAM protein [Chloroflexota bacterium]